MQINENIINKIEFNLTSNIFLNSGIVALDHYLSEFRSKTEFKYEFDLNKNKLTLKCDELLRLLEEIYYYMGKEIYDTSGAKSKEKVDKYFFKPEPFEAIPFPKMKTYGLSALITNDPTPTESRQGKKIKFDKLFKENINLSKEIAKFLLDKGKKLKFYYVNENGELKQNEIDKISGKRKENRGGESEIFLEAPYTKTPKLEFNNSYFENGENICFLTGESFASVGNSQNISPFISGLSNFNSFLKSEDKNVSWKVKYLSLFSPKLCFYSYVGGLESINIYFLNSDNLLNLKKLYKQNTNFYKNSVQLIQSGYISNFNLYNWASDIDRTKDYTEEFEFLFMLIYTFYKQILLKNVNIESKSNDWDPFSESEFKLIPISLVSIKADKTGKTMRPNSFENINNFKFLVRLIYFLEKKNINIGESLINLKFIKPTLKKVKNHYRLERQLRNKVLRKFILMKSFIDEIEKLFYDCYKYKISGEYIPYKNYINLMNLLILFEKIIKYGGNNKMNPKLQEWAINLGTMIGQAILRYENPGNKFDVQKTNAKNGRTYLIGLYKSRTQEQYNDAIIRIMNKYGIIYRKDLLSEVNEQNFKYIKQFAMISALNQINSIINPKNEENKNGTK